MSLGSCGGQAKKKIFSSVLRIPVLPSQRRVPEQLQLFGVLGAPMRGSVLVEWG